MPSQPCRILFINQYYWPDHASTAQHLADLAESLADRGVECHVLCAQGTYKPGEPIPPPFEIHRGVHIHRVPATSLGRKSTWRRMVDYLSFYARAVVSALRLPKFDAVVTLTTPPIIGLIGTMLRALKGSLHVYWSMDLHPDASLALGRMSAKNPIVRMLRWISDRVYRQADRVVVLGPYMADRIMRKGVEVERITSIPVWSRRDEIFPVPREANPLRKSLGLEKQFVAMYSGNLGLAHRADEFIEAAKRLKDRKDIVFLFVGGGPRVGEVRAAKETYQLENIRLLDYFPREQLHHSLTLADVHLISMRPEMTGIVVPGKLYGAMAASRTTIFVGPKHCETGDTIRQAGSGYSIEPEDYDGLVNAIVRLADDPSLARRMGERARSAFLAAYEKKLCCDQWNILLTDMIAARQPTPRTTESPVTQGLYS
ncbi:MAG: glycosyltransferase WbuB [Planctomycetes bacterium SCN 63-9]|nr:MAG: glycosyltransferase WbuB [Planctomycetes bacterium SCN 63-9]